MMAEFATSGMGVSEFSSVRGISRSTIHRYLRQQREQNEGNGARPQFLAVKLKATHGRSPRDSGELVLALNSGYKIEIGRGFDAVTLERLLSILVCWFSVKWREGVPC